MASLERERTLEGFSTWLLEAPPLRKTRIETKMNAKMRDGTRSRAYRLMDPGGNRFVLEGRKYEGIESYLALVTQSIENPVERKLLCAQATNEILDALELLERYYSSRNVLRKVKVLFSRRLK